MKKEKKNPAKEDLIGKVFGRWTVLAYSHYVPSMTYGFVDANVDRKEQFTLKAC